MKSGKTWRFVEVGALAERHACGQQRHQSKTKIKAIPYKPAWNAASHLRFSALADKKTAYFIDNVKQQLRVPLVL